ncbi:MAG: glutaminyl-peptide cyclotransferase [Alistipes sp.]
MRNILTIILSSILIASCSSGNARAPKEEPNKKPEIIEPTRYTYIVRNIYPHLTTSYTQGLQYIDGQLWEGTGEYGSSVLQRLDLETGRAKVVARLPRTEFGEGITVLGDSIFQLTWTSNTAHLYNRTTGKKITDFRYEGEGWGLTSDGQKLFMSNGSETIYTLDPATFRRERSVVVTFKGAPVRMLNELEWIDGRIWANVYMTDQIVIFDPATGVVDALVTLSGLLPAEDVTDQTDVLNGIAYDAATKRIFVTGKRWNKLFEIEIVKE